jgi:hypothetical protein
METNLPTLTRRGVLALAKEELGLPLSKPQLDKLYAVVSATVATARVQIFLDRGNMVILPYPC